MATQIIKHLSLLEYLIGADSDTRKGQLKVVPTSVWKHLINILLNVLYKNIDISKETKQTLIPFRGLLERVVTGKKTLRKRKSELMKDQNFYNLFSAILPDLRRAALDF